LRAYFVRYMVDGAGFRELNKHGAMMKDEKGKKAS
jgi:hypothetical protein